MVPEGRVFQIIRRGVAHPEAMEAPTRPLGRARSHLLQRKVNYRETIRRMPPPKPPRPPFGMAWIHLRTLAPSCPRASNIAGWETGEGRRRRR